MTDYVLLAIGLLYLCSLIFGLRRDRSPEIYAVWYVFSFFFLVFFYLYYSSAADDTDVTLFFGADWQPTLKLVIGTLTSLRDEIMLVLGVLYIGIAPQLMAYVLSGFSGSATSPRFVRIISVLSIWSLIKFLAGLSGILLAEPIGSFFAGKSISAHDFIRPVAFLVAAFFAAKTMYDYMSRGFEVQIAPGFRLQIRVPLLRKIHECFTKYAPEDEEPLADAPTRELEANLRRLRETFARYPEQDLFPRLTPQNAEPTAELEEPEQEIKLDLRWFVVYFRGLAALLTYELASELALMRDVVYRWIGYAVTFVAVVALIFALLVAFSTMFRSS